MVRKVSTTKQSSGGGFVFEDKVSAWFIAHLLSDNFVFSNDLGKIQKIQYQVRADGWLFDDILIQQKLEDNTLIKIAISSKSNTQFTSEGASSELVNDIWNQYTNEVSNVFNPITDYLCIINSNNDNRISKDINTLLKSARELDSKTLHQRIESNESSFSKKIKKIYNSFQCPEELSKKHNIDPSNIGLVLSRLIFLEFDFEATTSNSENQLIIHCKSCVRNPNGKNEVALFERLCSLRNIKAQASGSIDYDILINLLRDQFLLKGYQNHIDDWNLIKTKTISNLSRIPDKIGGKIEFDLKDQLNELSAQLKENKILFLTGKSGHGKSVLAKKLANSKLEEHKIIWIDIPSLNNGNIVDHFNIRNSIEELIHKAQDSNCILFIDGIDRFFKDSINEITSIINSAIKSEAWKVILTCQTDDFGDVIHKLYRNNITIDGKEFPIKSIGDKEFRDFQEEFPKLSGLFKNVGLKEILKNLKFLDLLAFNINSNSNLVVKESIGESEIIDLIWKETIETGGGNVEQKSRFLEILAEKQANDLSFSIPKATFNISDLAPLPILKQSKILEEINDNIFFSHDLYGDWARYKLIRANNDGNIKKFMLAKDLFSPLWCKAIRLYAMSLLEKETGCVSWVAFFKSLNQNTPNEKIIQDLCLEAIIFSSTPQIYLESIWEFMKEDEGNVLKRFLDRFLIKATVPNSKVLEWAKKSGSLTIHEASTYGRNLNHQYWGSILLFIHKHKEEFIELARKRVAMITGAWLEQTPIKILYRSEASEIALANAKAIFDFKNNEGIATGEVVEEIYKAMTFGVYENPSEVIDLSLKLCRRVQFEKGKKEVVEKSELESELEAAPFPKSYRREIKDAIPWPDGPYERVDNSFRTCCLEKGSLSLMMELSPDKAKEIILALLIDPPTRYSYYHDPYDYTHNKLDLYDPHWFPPFFTRGPFLSFLQINTDEGLDLIIKLINFSTNRWGNTFKNKGETVPSVTIHFSNYEKEYIGDSRMYFWFRQIGNAPNSIVSALMALERHLINLLKIDEDITKHIKTILEKGESVAYLGVLNSIGKYKPELFLEQLKHLLGTFDFYSWEMMLSYGASNIEGHQMIGANLLGHSTWELAKEWNEMPHRKRSITEYAILYAINYPEMQQYFKLCCIRWKGELDIIEAEGGTMPLMDNLMAQFNIDNYISIKDKGQEYLEYKEPAELTEKLAKTRSESTRQSQKTIMPFQIRQALEKKIVLSIEESEQLWEECDNTEIEVEDESGIPSMFESKFGHYALLLDNRKIWAEKHPEYLDFIITDTEKVLENYKPDLDGYTAFDIGFSWASFMARYLPSLWAENVRDKRLRKLIALVVLKLPHDIIKALFNNISQYKKHHDPEFIQVQNLLIQWSVGIYRFHGNIETNNPLKPLEPSISNKIKSMFSSKDYTLEFNIDKYASKIFTAFLDGKTPSTLLEFSTVRLEIPKSTSETRFGKASHPLGNQRGFSKEMIYHAFSSLPLLKNTSSIDEYKYTLNFWNQILEQFEFEFGEIIENPEDENEYPRDGDLEAIKLIAQLIVDIKSSDNPTQYWQKIYQYGGQAHEYIDRLASYFILYNIERKDKYKEFFSEWDKMIEYSENCNSWNEAKYYRTSRYIQEMKFSLVGLSTLHINCWDDDLHEFFEKAAPRMLEWMKKRFYNPDVIEKLLQLLRKKNGNYFLIEGIPLINAFLKRDINVKSKTPPEGYLHKEFEYVESLARTCSSIWENSKAKLIENESCYKSFKEVVTYLVSTQNSIGLELQERIIQG